MPEVKLLLILLLSLFIARQIVVTSEIHFYNYYCLNDAGNYTAGSAYQGNLKLLLHHLSTQASLAGFGTYSVGVGSDTVYGLYNCRRDLDLQICHDCVTDASEKIQQNCRTEREAVMWYEECTLRYANRSILTLEEESPFVWDETNEQASHPQQFTDGIAETMDGIIMKAAYDNSSGGFAVAKAAFSGYDAVHCLVQCTPDILGTPCEKCLRSALRSIAGCCGTSMVLGTMYFPSCHLRYDVKPFYNTSYRSLTQPPPVYTSVKAKKMKKSSVTIVAIPIIATTILALLLAGTWFCIRKRKTEKIPKTRAKLEETSRDLDEIGIMESLQFDFNVIKAATDNFSADNKLGQGGFGPVYKGMLQSGQDIAVKRLSANNAGQGIKEFKTEAVVVGKLQHKNLVRLLGFCVEAEERLLVYELVPNSSLDKFLFDPEKRVLLNWQTRYRIIVGIARGLMYLHEDSRLTIIHRDLKSGNVLLDEAMNPKISDFGTARLFGADQIQANTIRIVGTYGYMAPEYAMHGHFSNKSDVYSFGVMILELVSGQRSYFSRSTNQTYSLLHHAWFVWNNNELLSLVDETLRSNFSTEEVTKCIHIGLLCTQEDPEKRPTMSMIMHALNSNTPVSLPVPAQPQLLTTRDIGTTEEVSSSSVPSENAASSSQGLPAFSGSHEVSDVIPR